MKNKRPNDQQYVNSRAVTSPKTKSTLPLTPTILCPLRRNVFLNPSQNLCKGLTLYNVIFPRVGV